MALLESVAAQLRKPSGLVGRFVIARLLNRANSTMNQQVLELLALEPRDHVIEVGFGGGDLINRMIPFVSQGHISGVDFSAEMVGVCTRRFADAIRSGRIELQCASAEKLPYESNRFTKACTVNTIYFWADPLVPLGELQRLLRAGGRLLVGFNPPATMQKVPYTKYGFGHYEPEQVRSMLSAVGFSNVEIVIGSSGIGEFCCAVATK